MDIEKRKDEGNARDVYLSHSSHFEEKRRGRNWTIGCPHSSSDQRRVSHQLPSSSCWTIHCTKRHEKLVLNFISTF